MAGEEATEGSEGRRHMDLNLYVDLPPLPWSQVRIDTSVASSTLMMPNSFNVEPEAPRTSKVPEESLATAVSGEPEKGGSCSCKNSGFECNICLDVAKKPVVTACGHLFCWPCLYQWLYEQSPFPADCPVCKGEVLKEDITPIYGRGSEEDDSTTGSLDFLPPRPQANRRESARHQLQRAGHNVIELESAIVQLIQNQHGIVGGLPTPASTPVRTRMTSNAAPIVPASPQHPSSVGEPGPSRRSRRPSESQTTRTTRRRPQ